MRQIFYILLVLLISSCGESRFHGKLVEIDTLLCNDSVCSAHQRLMRLDTLDAGGEEDMAYYCLLRTIISFRKGEVQHSGRMTDRSLKYYTKVNDADKLAHIYYYKGRNAYGHNRVKEAMEFLKQAEHYSGKTSDNLIKAKILGNLAYCNMRANEKDLAFAHARRAISYSDKTDNYLCRITNYNNLGVIYGLLNNTDSSRHYMEKCVPLIRHISDREERAAIYANLAAAYEGIDSAKAEEYAEMSVKEHPLGHAYQILGNIHLRKGDTATADSFWREALKASDRYSRKISVMNGIAAQRRKEGRYREADEIAQEISVLRDSMDAKHRQDSIKDTQMTFDAEAELNKAEEKTGLWRIATACMVIAAASAAGFYILHERKKRRRIEQLKSREADYKRSIADSDKKIEMLMQKSKTKAEEVAKLKRKMKNAEKINIEKERLLTIKIGQQLWISLEKGGNVIKWKNDDYTCLFEYYKTVDAKFMEELSGRQPQLTATRQLLRVLQHAGKSEKFIMRAMNLQDSSLRSLKWRTSKAEQSPASGQ